ncbi:MAG: FecCD family ABC transporter permease [Treponemataceae bacterium]
MSDNLFSMYKRFTGKILLFNILLLIAVFVMIVVSINAGSVHLEVPVILKALFNQGSEEARVIIWKIRLPRIIAAIVAGAGLSVAGCIMQNNLRNPLASPSTLGITSAAAFGANVAIIVLSAGSMQSSTADAVTITNPYLVTLSAFVCSMGAMFIVIFLAKIKGFRADVIVLAGVSISSLFGAGITFLQFFANERKIASAVFWTFGNLGRIAWKELVIMSIVVVVSIIYFLFRSWDYNAFNVGEDSAGALGVNIRRVRFGGLFFSSVVTAVAVSFLGIISFVGLIGPQIMRMLIGTDHKFLIPGSAIMGALILLVSDTVARTILSPVILPVGVITSFLGAPLFLYVLLHEDKILK